MLLLLWGLDSLYVSFNLDVGKSALDFEELAYRKERVKESRAADFDELSPGSETSALRPYGKHPYRFILSDDAFEGRAATDRSMRCDR